jgi:hypothetical protein
MNCIDDPRERFDRCAAAALSIAHGRAWEARLRLVSAHPEKKLATHRLIAPAEPCVRQKWV